MLLLRKVNGRGQAPLEAWVRRTIAQDSSACETASVVCIYKQCGGDLRQRHAPCAGAHPIMQKNYASQLKRTQGEIRSDCPPGSTSREKADSVFQVGASLLCLLGQESHSDSQGPAPQTLRRC
jgi:hypothetical protein